MQQGVGLDIGIHQTTVSKIVNNVSRAICEKKNKWIKFPASDDALNVAKEEWAVHHIIPNVIGAIDCTHVKILKPHIHGDEYVNRKGVCSINVQTTCDHREKFTSVDASWPGSVHDSRIWYNSSIYSIMFHNQQNVCLLGDSGYAAAPWMLTPFKNPLTNIEQYFNRIHAKERVIIERCFGQLKRRFPILHDTVRLKTDRICQYVMSAFILHNCSKFLNDPNDFEPIYLEEEPVMIPVFPEGSTAKIRRQGIQFRSHIAEQIYEPRIAN